MRLIDADELADYITENEDDFLYALKHKDRHVLDSMIEKIPTAYDIDKVVEELEEEREEILNSNDYENEIINYCLDSFDTAIEIVKRGGKND